MASWRARLHRAAGGHRPGKAGKELGIVEQAFVEVFGQVGVRQPTVPVLHNVPAIHDLAKDVAQVLPGNLGHQMSVVLKKMCHIWQSDAVHKVCDLWVPPKKGSLLVSA